MTERRVQIGAAVGQLEELSMEIQGRDQVSGLPRTITITTSEVVEAIQEPLSMTAGVAKRVLRRALRERRELRANG